MASDGESFTVRRATGGGSETRPHLSDDEGVEGPTTRKEVSYGSVYHTPAPIPDPSPPNPARTPTRAGARRHPPRGHRPTDPHRRGRHLEAGPLHPLADLLDLLLANPQPRSLLPGRPQAARRLDGTPGSEARRRGHRSVLQGPRAAA